MIGMMVLTLANPPEMDGKSMEVMAAAWVKILEAAKVTPDELESAVIKYCGKSKFWPAVSELIEIVKSNRPPVVYSAPELPQHAAMTDDERAEARKYLAEKMKRLGAKWDETNSRLTFEKPEWREDSPEEIQEAQRSRELQIEAMRNSG